MVDIYTLVEGATYVVNKKFTDFYRSEFLPGERLIYAERHFVPYHGGHTIVFKDRNLYLQENQNQDIIDRFAEYLSRVDV